MAIRVKLDHLLLDRRITLTDLAERVGITIANLSVLKTNKARAIRFSTLDALCRELKCQPGDLLEWTSEEPLRLMNAEGRKDGANLTPVLSKVGLYRCSGEDDATFHARRRPGCHAAAAVPSASSRSQHDAVPPYRSRWQPSRRTSLVTRAAISGGSRAAASPRPTCRCAR